MQTYDMPPDTREKEKVIGGVLNINQFGWIVGGLIILLVIILTTYKFLGIISVFVGLPFVIIGIMFAVRKKNDMTYFQYLRYKRRYKKTIKYYINKQKRNGISISNINL